MKTIIVLSALVAVALAAPAQLEETEDFKKTLTNGPETFKRDKKSAPQESASGSNSAPDALVNLPSSSQKSESTSSARSFALKKPIIVKRKQGYHVYRDSDEEDAESGESCGKQVKVKLCDDKSEDKMRSSTIEDADTHMTEEDMKQSIKLAKEAVENLQRDLKIVERKPRTKASAWKHGQSESDTELHQDIEVAREALEHIHKNFGNLESMSLHARTLENADTVQDSHLAITKTEAQRLAQWKEAIDTIQKNFEIAKNIEDSFKARAASGETGLLFSDDMIDHGNEHEFSKNNFMRANEDVPKKEEKAHSDNCKTNILHEKSSEKENIKAGSLEDDMSPSASTITEQKIEHNSEKARQASGLDTNIHKEKSLKPEPPLEQSHKEKDADMEAVDLQNLFQKSSVTVDSMKAIEEKKERNSQSEPQNKKHSLTEAITDNVPAAINKMKSVESEDLLLDHERKAAADTHDQPQKFLKPEDHVSKIETSEKKNIEMKSAEHIHQQHGDIKKHEGKQQDQLLHAEQARADDTMTFMKSAQLNPVNKQKQFIEHTKVNDHGVNADQSKHHLNAAKMAQEEALKHQAENNAPNNAEQIKTHGHMQSLKHPEMRAVEDLHSMHQHHHQLSDMPQTRWAEDKNHHLHVESIKSADNIPSQSMDHAQMMQHPGHHHQLAHGMKSHHFDSPNGHDHPHLRFPDNFMPQGKSADMDMQSYYMSMRDGSGLGPESQRFRWTPMHEAARSAYGAPAAPAASGGAVGVFPNAKVGGCGIPLLLSCNPSVVSGNLASSPPAAYSAPAYRSEDNFNFHTKRDVKKTHENLPSSHHRTPSNVNVKTSTVLVAKE